MRIWPERKYFQRPMILVKIENLESITSGKEGLSRVKEAYNGTYNGEKAGRVFLIESNGMAIRLSVLIMTENYGSKNNFTKVLVY